MTAIDEYFPFDAGSGSNVTENQWRKMAQNWRADGVLPVPSSSITVVASWAVSPNAGMVLNVATGAVTILGHYGGITSTKTVTIAANSSGNPRIDYVVARLDTVANTISVEVLTGTPAATPAAPALTQTSATWEIPIAQIAVANGAVTISADNITDRRNIYPGLTTAPNIVRNCSGQIAQRGTSISCGTSNPFTLDRWRGFRTGLVAGLTVSQQVVADWKGDNYAIRMQRDNGNASTAVCAIEQSMRSIECTRFAGRTATLSIRARKGTNFSAASNVLVLKLFYGTGTDQTLYSGLTGQTQLVAMNNTVSATFQDFMAVVSVPASATQLAIEPSFTPVGTAGAADWVEIKDIRLDEGDRPLPNVTDPEVELENAQRYFWRCGGAAATDILAQGQASSTTVGLCVVEYPVEMRAVPTFSVGDATKFVINDVSTSNATTAVALSGAVNHTKKRALVAFTGSGLTAARAVVVYSNASTNGYMDFTAEI